MERPPCHHRLVRLCGRLLRLFRTAEFVIGAQALRCCSTERIGQKINQRQRW